MGVRELLYQSIQDLDLLAKQVLGVRQLAPALSRHVPMIASEPFKFALGDFNQQERLWANEGEDFYLHRIGFTGVALSDTIAKGDPIEPLATDVGTFLFQAIDFVWNLKWNWADQMYCASQRQLMVSRRALGNTNSEVFLEFTHPVRIKGGDSLTLYCKPIAYFISSDTDTVIRVISINMYGERTGRMAPSDFIMGPGRLLTDRRR